MGEMTLELDSLLTLEEAAAWLRMSKRDLAVRSKGRYAKIPAFWFNERVVRFHPRTITAKLAADAGVKPEIIAAAFNPNTQTKT